MPTTKELIDDLYLYTKTLAKTPAERAKLREKTKELTLHVKSKFREHWSEIERLQWEKKKLSRLPPPPPDPLGFLMYKALFVRGLKKPQTNPDTEKNCPLCEKMDIEEFIEKMICGECKTPEEIVKCSDDVLEIQGSYVDNKLTPEQFSERIADIGKKYNIDMTKAVGLVEKNAPVQGKP